MNYMVKFTQEWNGTIVSFLPLNVISKKGWPLSLYLKLNRDSVVNKNLGGLDPVWDKVMGQFSSERKNIRPIGRPGQAMRLERRRRSLVSGQMRSEVFGVRNDTTVKVINHVCDVTIVKVVV
jgi:hypothetical protein